MSKTNYPTEITPEVLEKAKHISNEEIILDLFEAEQELESDKKLVAAAKLQAEAYKPGSANWRMACFRRDGYGNAVEELGKQITFFKTLLKARGVEDKRENPI